MAGKDYIAHKCEIKVRFGEVDSMRIVWHGNYLKYFEDARESFGDALGLSYLDIYNSGYVTPIVKSTIEHKAPLYYGSKAIVEIKLIQSPAAKIIHQYTVWDSETGKVAAEGETVQVFLDKDGELQLVVPNFYESWKKKLNWSKD